MPSMPRKPFIASVRRACRLARPHRTFVVPDQRLGTCPQLLISRQCPASRSGAARDGIITAVITREYPDTITSTGGRPF